MALPKQKERKPPRAQPDKSTFDPYWTRLSGAVDHVEQYIQYAAREAKGWFRGARIR